MLISAKMHATSVYLSLSPRRFLLGIGSPTGSNRDGLIHLPEGHPNLGSDRNWFETENAAKHIIICVADAERNKGGDSNRLTGDGCGHGIGIDVDDPRLYVSGDLVIG